MLKNHTIISPLSLPWNWSADYQRQTLMRLAKHNKVIIYDQNHAHFFLKKPTPSGSLESKLPKNIFLYTPRYFLPFRSVPAIERLNRKLSYWLLLFSLRRERKIVWIFDLFFAFMTRKLSSIMGGKTTTLYDCVDYHAGHPDAPADTASQEKVLIRQSDFFFVNSRALYEQHAKLRARTGKETHLVAQGFDQQTFEQVSKKIPSLFAKKQPLIGYAGGINNRIDFPLVEQLVRANPQWNFGFWGPIQDTAAGKKLQALQKLPNFHYGGALKRSQLTSVMGQFDVGIIPYAIHSSFNRLSYPMKVLEYFYLGKPVISTPIQELTQFPEWVALAVSAKAWQTQLIHLLKHPWPREYQQAQKKFAIQNSWEKKLTAISAVLGQTHQS